MSNSSAFPKDLKRITNYSLAICADIDHVEHPENAGKVGSSIYIPSIVI